MEAILGTIREMVPLGDGRFRVVCEAVCVLPGREVAPRAVITVERATPDARELGGPGDGIVLTPEESAPWLPPERLITLENAWCRLRLTTRRAGGAVWSWQECGRPVEHFARESEHIADPLACAGHADAFRTAWTAPRRIEAVRVTEIAVQARSLHLTGRISRRLTTELHGQLLDDLPLLHWQRSVRVTTDGKRRHQRREPIEEAQSLGLGACATWPAADAGRVLTVCGDRLVSLRAAEAHQYITSPGWRMQCGWALAEYPRCALLYLFDTAHPPRVIVGRTPTSMTLNVGWPMCSVSAGESLAMGLGLAAGECCGAGVGGAWVGSRTPRPEGGVRCAVVGRLPGGTATFTLGGETREAVLRPLFLTGVGTVMTAQAEFPAGRLDAPLSITAGELAPREAA